MTFLKNLFGRRWNAGATILAPSPQAAPAPIPAPDAETAAAATLPAEDCVTLPLKAITDLFPQDLKAALHKQPSEHVRVNIPRAIIRPQLASGAVRITFAQLRAATPAIFFNPGAAPDDAKLALPLEYVVRQMTPSRREDQRQPAIPVNIPSIFAKAEQANAPGAAKKEAWYSHRRLSYEADPQSQPTPEPATPTAPAAPLPTQSKKPFIPLASVTERHRRGDPAPPAAPAGFVAVPVSEVLPELPEEIRLAFNGSDPRTIAFVIPVTEIEPRLRTGRLVFQWEQLRAWCGTPLADHLPPAAEVALPLAAVVPLFMAARGPQDPRKQIEVSSRIPDIFGKAKSAPPDEPAAAPPTAPQPTAPTPPTTAVAPPAPAAPLHTPRPASSGPAQIVEHLRGFHGVIGAFIATSDGLLVAGDVPDGNDNILAAFAPTVFSQLSKYSDMARLGSPEAIDLQLTGVSLHVRKAGQLYLGALMRSGQPAPIAEFARISAALQPHTS